MSCSRLLLLALLSACTATRAAAPIVYQVEPVPDVIGCSRAACVDRASQVEITYLGVGGVMVRHRGHVLLTAPFYSTPTLPAVTRSVIRPDPTLIERLLPRDADSASAILVGHSHYDHLLDIPYIANRRARGAMIYGSPSVRNILLGDPGLKQQPGRLVAFDSAAIATIDRETPWIYTSDSAFRFMPIRAAHAPTLKLLGGGAMFANGVVDRPLDTLPTRADGWKLGEQLSFLVDVLAPGDTTPVLRLYYEDAPNRPPYGSAPRSVLARRHVDVAILCAATATHVPDTPGALLDYLKPGYVIVTHWEDFFRPQTLPIKLNPYTDADFFMETLSRRLPVASRWSMPLPRTTLRFAAQ